MNSRWARLVSLYPVQREGEPVYTMPSDNRWYVNHQDIKHNFYPGQEVTIAEGVNPETLLNEPKTNRFSVQVLRQMKKINATIKLKRTWIDDGQLLTETHLKDGVAYIPAQYLVPINIKQRTEYQSDIEKAMEGLADSLLSNERTEEDDY